MALLASMFFVIEMIGPEFDQSRLHYLSAPMSAEFQGPVMGLQAHVKRWMTSHPNFQRPARRFELQAQAALAQGHAITASEAFFAAAIMYGGAQWPIFANTDLNKAVRTEKDSLLSAVCQGGRSRD